jgi:hypothetical protein
MTDEFIEMTIQFPHVCLRGVYDMSRDPAGPFALLAFQPGRQAGEVPS